MIIIASDACLAADIVLASASARFSIVLLACLQPSVCCARPAQVHIRRVQEWLFLAGCVIMTALYKR